jgi:peptidyl-prolyl cis-trans isomerase C
VELLVLDRLYVQAAEKAGLTNDPQVQRALGTAEDQVLAVRYAQFVEQKITLDDAQRYYQAHPEEFRRPDQLWLRQIVVATPENAQLVKDTLGRGQSFEEVAKAFSTDKNSAANGGDIGWVRKGRLHPEVEKVAFRLKPKQVSEPIKTPGGYYIIRLEERLDGTMKPFDEIASNLLLRLKSVAVDAERKRLMTTYKVAINQELL